MCVNVCLLHTMHLVAFYKGVVNSDRTRYGSLVLFQIPAQVLIKCCGHEVELFVIVLLHEEKREIKRGKVSNDGFIATFKSF